MSKLYQEGAESTASSEGKDYQLDVLFKLVQGRKSVKMKISELAWILRYTKTDDERVRKANIKVPLLVYFSEKEKAYVTLDGAHRLFRAYHDGEQYLPAFVLSQRDLVQAQITPSTKPRFMHW